MATVLVADDDTDIRELVARTLRSRGHRILAVEDGARAVEAARSGIVDLAVLDVTMPHKTGLEVCRELRAATSTAALPIILLTARTAEADEDAGFGRGADIYMTKPFSTRDLCEKVSTLLSRTPSQRFRDRRAAAARTPSA